MSFKIDIGELREMVAAAVRTVVTEKKQRNTSGTEVPQRSPESIAAQVNRAKRGLPGYQESDVNDFSLPLGKHSIVKRQGASGIGGWTSEGRLHEEDDRTAAIIQVLVSNGVPQEKAPQIAQQLAAKIQVTPMAAHGGDTGLSDPSHLGLESRVQRRVYEMQVRKLVRMIVREEVRAARRR